MSQKKMTPAEALENAVSCYTIKPGSWSAWLEAALTNNWKDNWKSQQGTANIQEACYDTIVKPNLPDGVSAESLREVARKVTRR